MDNSQLRRNLRFRPYKGMAARKKESPAPVLSATGVVPALPVHIELPQFSGSLPMLFACVRERKLELADIPLLPICEAYFAYLVEHAEANLDEAAAALAALAWLLERKAWMLLPVDEEPELPEELAELPEPTADLYKPVIDLLKIWEEERERIFFRPNEAGPDPYELPFTLGDVTAGDLARALDRLLLKASPEPPSILSPHRRSLSEQMAETLRLLPKEWTGLDVLIPTPFTRTDAVYWFLALLELIRLGQALVRLYDGDVQFARSR